MNDIYLKYSLGIDSSKDENQVCLSVIGQSQKVTVKASKKFSNGLKGFYQLDQWIKKHHKLDIPLRIVLEASGVYHEQLAWFLNEKNYPVSIILPNKAKNYMKALGLKSKNDKIDAQGLSRMGAEQNLPLWQPCSKQLLSLKRLTRHYERLQNTKTSINNQLHAIKHCYEPNKVIINSLEKLIKELDKQLNTIKKKIEVLVDKDDILHEKIEKIVSSIKGLGLLTVVSIVSETDGFSNINNQRQLTSYAGYDVVEKQSGKRIGKTKISKKGNSHIRRSLHLPALNMVRYQVKPFESLYVRIHQRTGIKMKAYGAIQRKLLLLIYTLWKKNEQYEEQFYKNNSSIEEAKPSFRLASKKPQNNSLGITKATLDGLPFTESAEALFSLIQT